MTNIDFQKRNDDVKVRFYKRLHQRVELAAEPIPVGKEIYLASAPMVIFE